MAGTVTITTQKLPQGPPGPVTKVTLAWTSDAAGAVSGTPTSNLAGVLARVAFVPGSGGSQPSANYDVTITDGNGVDVLAGQGANLSETTATQVCPGVPLKDGTTTGTTPCVVNDALNLVVANAGNAKSGSVVLYIL